MNQEVLDFYFKVTKIIGAVLADNEEDDDVLFWELVHHLTMEYPNLDWRNAISDGFPR